MIRSRLFVLAAGSLVAFGLGCGGDADDGNNDGGASSPDAPKFLSFGTNVAEIDDTEAVTFTAVLTDPNGINDLIGGSLKSQDGKVQYGAFITSEGEGAYSLNLSWDQIDQAETIEFEGALSRMFVAEFFDKDGNSVTETVSISLQCDDQGGAACGGVCTSLADDRDNCGACGVACASVNAIVNNQSVTRIVFDATHAYWINRSRRQVLRSEINTGSVDRLTTVTSFDLADIAIDDTHVYWTDPRDDVIQRIAKDGTGGVETVVSTTLSQPEAVAVDDTHVYWLDRTAQKVARAPKAVDSTPEDVATGQALEVNNFALALDATHVYWQAGDEIRKIAKAGGDPIVLAENQDDVRDIALDATHVYWSTAAHIARVPADGSSKAKIVASGLKALKGLAIDDSFVFFTQSQNQGINRVGRVAKDGGIPRVIANGQDGVRQVGIAGSDLYWAAGTSIATSCKCVLAE